MTSRRTGLGRGLSALIPSAQPAVQQVDLDMIVPNPEQPRDVFEAGGIVELAESIREHGVIQPLIVSRPEGNGGGYQLIAGERRLLAARQAGLKQVPVVVREASSQALLELALVENLQRQDLGPLEEASAFRRLAEEYGLTQEAISARVGRSRPAVANALRLLSLPHEIQTSLARGEISAGHARAILAIEGHFQQITAWRRILEAGLSVREAESLAKATSRPPKPTTSERTRAPDLLALEERLQSTLGTKVDLKKGKKGGRLVIHFYSDEELDSLLGRLE